MDRTPVVAQGLQMLRAEVSGSSQVTDHRFTTEQWAVEGCRPTGHRLLIASTALCKLVLLRDVNGNGLFWLVRGIHLQICRDLCQSGSDPIEAAGPNAFCDLLRMQV